jgi:hypothetical protein
MLKESMMVQASETAGMDAPQAGLLRSSRLGGKIRVVESWYGDDPVSFEGCDLWISHQRSQPVSPGRWLYFYTIHVDLTLEPDVLLSNMRKNTSREIRNAQDRDGLSYSINHEPSDEDIEEYARFYDANPRTTDQEPTDRGRLREFAKAGLVHLAQVYDAEGAVLAQHCLLYHQRSSTIQLSSLVSLHHGEANKSRGSAIGRANRWLFYREFLSYKEKGCQVYDLNGWYAGTEDEKRLRINLFKEGFRGRILYGYDCVEPVSPRGWVYVTLQAVKRRLFQPEQMKEIRRRRQKAPRLPEAEEF